VAVALLLVLLLVLLLLVAASTTADHTFVFTSSIFFYKSSGYFSGAWQSEQRTHRTRESERAERRLLLVFVSIAA
jgi:hypothetical protein